MITHLVPLLITVAAAADNASRLLQVQIIIRHADIAPQYEFTSPEFEQLFSRGLGEITNDGLLHTAQQGIAFQQRYSDLGLLSEQTSDIEVFVRSSPAKRALMSAAAFSSALTGHIMPPIRTTESIEGEKVLVIHHSLQHNCKVLSRHNISDRPLCRPTELINEFIKQYPECAEFSYTTIEAALAEIEHPEVALDSALQKCASGSGRAIQFKALSIRAGIADEFDIVRLRSVIGPLMSIIGRNVDSAVRSDLFDGVNMVAPVRIYYTHSNVILAAAQALGVIAEFNGKSPEFSSAIAIETWSNDEGFDVKIVQKDGVNNPFKPLAEYPFLEFKKHIWNYTAPKNGNTQWDDKITKTYNLIQFGMDIGETREERMPEKKQRVRRSTEDKTWIGKVALGALMVITAIRIIMRRKYVYTRIFGQQKYHALP